MPIDNAFESVTDAELSEEVPQEEQILEESSGVGGGSLDEIDDLDFGIFDVPIKFSEEEEKALVTYLEENLPKMRPTDEEKNRILSFLSIYEMSAEVRSFPYEGAPSLASSDLFDKTNAFLDVAETAFLNQKSTFVIDREECVYSEENVRRMEKTFHKKFFVKTMWKGIRPIIFDSACLGGTILCPTEKYDVRPEKSIIFIRDSDDLEKALKDEDLEEDQIEKAKEAISKGEEFAFHKESLKMIHSGVDVVRVNLNNFWFPRNSNSEEEWQIVSTPEYYTKSSLLGMAERGEFKKSKVDLCISNRMEDCLNSIDKNNKKSQKLPENVKCFKDLDNDWSSDIGRMREQGNSYEDEFVVHRVTLLYGVKTKKDPNGNLKMWIQVMYCPAGRCILGAKVCQDGFPYFLVQYRPVPYKLIGPGIAQERYHYNILTTELMSYALAAIEQDLGAPLLLRDGSGLYASNFRAFPGSVTYTQDPNADAKFLPFPEKSDLAIKGMSAVIGSSPQSNLGAGYSSGKRQGLLDQKELSSQKSRIFSIAMDLDRVISRVWKMQCRLARYNTDGKKLVEWVYKNPPSPSAVKLYILESEMDPEINWSSTTTAVSLTPDARLQQAMMRYEFFYKNVPVAVNNPRLSIAWQEYMAEYFDDMDEATRKKLLATLEDFAQYQQQLGAMGGGGQENQATPLAAQSPGTPFRNPASGQ